MLFLALGFISTGFLFVIFEGQPRYHIPHMLFVILIAVGGFPDAGRLKKNMV